MDSDNEDIDFDPDEMLLDDDELVPTSDLSDDEADASAVPAYALKAFTDSQATAGALATYKRPRAHIIHKPCSEKTDTVAVIPAAAAATAADELKCPEVTVMFPQVFAWAHAKCKKNPDAKFVKRMKIPSNVNCSLNNFIIVSAPKTTEEDLEDAVNQDDDAYCELCNTVKQFDARTAQAICLTCGLSSTYMVPDTSYREGVSIHSPYLYKRINHCRDHLHRITGRESTQIEPEVIERISSELAKTHRPEELCNVTQTDIRLLLKRLGLSRLYNHTTRIWALTTGGKPLVLTQTQEQELLHLFNLIQVPWEKLRPKNRKNFLSYSYLLHKLSLLLGYTDVASHFKLLKSKEKVHFQDLYWQKICAAMGFRFERSVY